MDINVERRIHMEKLLNFLNVTYRRFPAVNGPQFSLDSDYLNRYVQAKNIRKIFKRYSIGTSVTDTQAGCYMSHLLALIDIAETKTTKPTILLEDDVDMEVNALEIISNTITTLPDDWQWLLCGYCCFEVRRNVSENVFEVQSYVVATCQVVRNASVARYVAQQLDTHFIWQPVDHRYSYLAYTHVLKTYALTNPVMIQRSDLFKSGNKGSLPFFGGELKISLADFLISPNRVYKIKKIKED